MISTFRCVSKVIQPCRTYSRCHGTLKELQRTRYVHTKEEIELYKIYPWFINKRFSTTGVNTSEKSAESKPSIDEETKTTIPDAQRILQEEIAKLIEARDSLDDKYRRSLAETENVRRRMQKQIDDAKLYGIHGFCKDLLEVADILDKATESIPPESLTEDSSLKDLYSGLTMTNAQLKKVFGKHGLKEINPAGEKFNPNEHEALFQQAKEGLPAGLVVDVAKVGYKLHDRTIRPAQVGVSKDET